MPTSACCAHVTLAQSLGDRFGGASVPRIPEPPLIAHRLFEEPLPLVILLAGAAVLVWFVLSRAGKARQGRIAAGGLAVAAVLPLVLAAAVQTEREVLIGRSKELIDTVAAGNVAAVDSLLRADATARPWELSHDTILTLVSVKMLREYATKEHEVLESRASIDGPNVARTQLRVRVVADNNFYRGPIGSWWTLHWAKSASDNTWKVQVIECQHIDGLGDPKNQTP